MGRLKVGNDRGIALLIVLLITALLIALIFEFAYATRVSLNGAVNFRDNQRAYFLARSGVNFAGMLLAKSLKDRKFTDNLEQKDWQVVPIVSSGDVVLQVRWEDERGKININMINQPNPSSSTSPSWPEQLLRNQGVGTDAIDKVKERRKEGSFRFLSELHTVMSDEDYNKVAKFLTVDSDQKIDINTASEEVLECVLAAQQNAPSPSTIISTRKDQPYISMGNTGLNTGNFDFTSNTFKVYSYATVGGYTKQVEAIITRNTTGFSTSYWRAL